MYLKSIEFLGYKSFADKTKLDFEPGLTGIVGPNGCGKSNIIDGVRWCLGEMSWKSLRAGAMTDVIFAGSEGRQPLGFAEVSLAFDNSKGLLAVPYEEVMVTRRLYRSGESEYLLNKGACRLKDIRELFLDTGIGADGYAIIDQGGVDFVVRANPEERRGLFEEAAGVAKFGAKREEALRKLDRVEIDLGRLKDSLALIDEQVRKLDSEARKAKQYKKHKEELTALEVGNVLLQIDALGGELAEIAEKAKPIHEEIGLKSAQASAEGAILAALNLERVQQQNVVVESNRSSSEVKEQIGRLEERGAAADDAIRGAGNRRAACEVERAAALDRLTALDPEIDVALAALEAAKAERDGLAAEVRGCRERLEAAERQARESEAEVARLQGEKTSLLQESVDADRRVNEAESSISRQVGGLTGTLRGLARDEAAAEGLRRELEAERARLGERRAAAAAARAEAGDCDRAAAESRAALANVVAELSRVGRESLETRLKVESLETEGRRDPYWSGAQAVAGAGIGGIVGTVRSLLELKDESKRAFIEDVLGERLHAVVCEDTAAAQAGIEYLAQTLKGRARFLVLGSVPPAPQGRAFPAQALPLAEAVSCDQRFEGAVRFLLAESYVVGKAVFGDHWVCGGAASPETAQPTLFDLEGLRARGTALKSREAELSARRTALEAEGTRLETRQAGANAALAEASGRENASAAAVDQRTQSLGLKEGDVGASTSEAADQLRDLALAMERVWEARHARRMLAARIEESAAKEAALRGSLAERERERSEAKAVAQTADERVRNAETGVALREQGVSGLASEKERLQLSVSAKDDELADLEARRKELEAGREACGRERTGLLEKLKELEAAAKAAADRFGEIQARALEKETVVRQLEREVAAAKERLNGFDVQASGAKSRQDMHKTRLWEEWQVTESEARERHPLSGPVDLERLETLKKRIAAMGNINMAAPEDYELLVTKQISLSNQIDDMNKAKEDLKTAIQKINATTRENFRQTFMEVREHFRRLYGVLFEGGEADLVLKDPDNLLESGIDIVAQPPGKKLQHLSLLSGGEKSLTAIALLFSFFAVRPSPFCLLDEADHALDESNTARFTSLIQEFQSKTQFIVITHKKRTMEAMEVIYGVTMPDKGVSQVVSIDFKKRPASRQAAEPSPAGSAPAAVSAPEPVAVGAAGGEAAGAERAGSVVSAGTAATGQVPEPGPDPGPAAADRPSEGGRQAA